MLQLMEQSFRIEGEGLLSVDAVVAIVLDENEGDFEPLHNAA